MQQPITITLNLQLKLKVKLKDNKAEAEIIDAESEQVEDDDMLLKRKLALMLSTAFAEWSGYPLICNGSKGTNLINYKMWGNSEQNGTPSPTSPVDIISVGDKLLPTGYTQLEYIKSTGSQYIDTGILPTNNMSVESLFKYNDSTSMDILSSGSGDNDLVAFFNRQSNGNCRTIYGNYPNKYVEYNVDTITDFTKGVVNITPNSQSVYFNNVLVSTSTFSANGNSVPMPLFARRFGSDIRKASASIKYCKIWKDGTLVRDFIPAKNSSNVVGMYDLVTDTFFTNAGSGSFTAGSVKVSYKIPVVASNQDGTETTTTNIYLSAPLRKVGDYADYIDFENQQVVRNVGYTAFTGTEGWTLNSSGVSGLFQIAIKGSKLQNTAPYIGYCSHFYPKNNKSASFISTGQCTFQGISSGRVSVRYTDYDNDLAVFKAWLAAQHTAGTPVEVVYPLATPTTESITLPALPTFDGYTKFETSTTVKPSNMYGKG